MSTNANTVKKFRKNQNVKFTLGRGGKYTGKVIGIEEDGYLTVQFLGKSPVNLGAQFTRRISPTNARPA